MERAMAQHDHSYKLLFSHPEMVRDLLRGFVREEWLAHVDWASLEKVNGSYVSDDLQARANDLVWRVRWGERWVYVYLLLEFQSSVDRYMAVRMLAYVALLYQDLIKTGQLPEDGLLPPVFPIVLYNGFARWHAPNELDSLIQPGPATLDVYRPRIRYLLIDERRYRDSELASLRNLAAALFRLENSPAAADIVDVVKSLVEWLKHPEQKSLRRAFRVWLENVILPRRSARPHQVEELEEMRTVLSETIERWKAEFRLEGLREGREEGLVKGREEGLEEGLREGEIRVLLRLLRRRFGELPHAVLLHIEHATLEELDQWTEKLLDADVQSLEMLFEKTG